MPLYLIQHLHSSKFGSLDHTFSRTILLFALKKTYHWGFTVLCFTVLYLLYYVSAFATRVDTALYLSGASKFCSSAEAVLWTQKACLHRSNDTEPYACVQVALKKGGHTESSFGATAAPQHESNKRKTHGSAHNFLALFTFGHQGRKALHSHWEQSQYVKAITSALKYLCSSTPSSIYSISWINGSTAFQARQRNFLFSLQEQKTHGKSCYAWYKKKILAIYVRLLYMAQDGMFSCRQIWSKLL